MFIFSCLIFLLLFDHKSTAVFQTLRACDRRLQSEGTCKQMHPNGNSFASAVSTNSGEIRRKNNPQYFLSTVHTKWISWVVGLFLLISSIHSKPNRQFFYANNANDMANL